MVQGRLIRGGGGRARSDWAVKGQEPADRPEEKRFTRKPPVYFGSETLIIDLAVANLPWGQEPFRVRHYRVSNTDRFDPPVESSGQDGKLEITRTSAAPAVEWFVLELD